MASPLDNLYGNGATAKFERAWESVSTLFPGIETTIKQASSADAPAHVEVEWHTTKGVLLASISADFHPRYVNYTSRFTAPQFRGKGITEHDVVAMRPLLVSAGVEALTCEPTSARIQWLLELGGLRWVLWNGTEHFGCLLRAGDRTDEFAKWVEAGRLPATEPAWRTALLASPPQGEEVF